VGVQAEPQRQLKALGQPHSDPTPGTKRYCGDRRLGRRCHPTARTRVVAFLIAYQLESRSRVRSHSARMLTGTVTYDENLLTVGVEAVVDTGHIGSMDRLMVLKTRVGERLACAWLSQMEFKSAAVVWLERLCLEASHAILPVEDQKPCQWSEASEWGESVAPPERGEPPGLVARWQQTGGSSRSGGDLTALPRASRGDWNPW
jgi:hypothetical protein